jgi:hypothetical protein
VGSNLVTTAARSGSCGPLEDEEPVDAVIARRLPQLVALRPDELLVVNLELPSAIATALGVAPRLKALWRTLRSALLDFDFDLVEALEDFALVLNHAHGEYLVAIPPEVPHARWVKEALHLRRALRAKARGLVAAGVISSDSLALLQGTASHRAVANDLVLLAELERRNVLGCSAQSVRTAQEAERVRIVTAELLAAMGNSQANAAELDAARDFRQRAFTLFVRSYAEARAGVAFVRRNHGDVDRLIPSLYSRRRAGRARSKSTGAARATRRGN